MEVLVDKDNKRKNFSNSIQLNSNGEMQLNHHQSILPNQLDFKLYHSTSLNYGANDNSLKYRSKNIFTNTNNLVSRQNSFIHDSINSSLDFPTYIPWQTLSSEVNDNLRSGALRINKSNCVEWASPIQEMNEKAALLINTSDDLNEKRVTKATTAGISWQVASFLLVNCALGAGILNYPQAYDKVGGILIATALQIILIIVLGFTMLILVYSSDLNKDNTYHDVILSMCGKRIQQLAAVSILLTCYGICVTFLIIIGDQMEKIFDSLFIEDYWFTNRKYVIAYLSIFFVLPMCYFKRLDFLKYAGTLGVFSMLYIVFINVYQYFYLQCENVELKTRPENYKSMIAVIPVICFAYQTHEITVPVYASMNTRTVKNFTKTTILTLVILFILYSLAGTFSYLTFGTSVSSDIMMMYDSKRPMIMFGIAALVIKMITTYPPMLFCGRGALDGLYAEFFNVKTIDFIEGNKKRSIIITTIWFFSSLLLAIFTPNIGVVIELLGSLASINVFIFPSVCLIVIIKKLSFKLSNFQKFYLYAFSVFLIIFGICIFFIVVNDVYNELFESKKTELFLNVTICKYNNF